MDFLDICIEINNILKEIPKTWDGKESILKMKDGGSTQWKQMEWIGFYFEFLCSEYLSEIMEMPGVKYGNVSFDGFLEIPWDFKSHSSNSSSKIIVNDTEAIENAIKDYGSVGLIVAVGNVEYDDENRSFYKWHENIKGGKSQYELDRIKRKANSRRRKKSFELEKINFIRIDEDVVLKHGSFQKNFRNSNGTPRRSKVLLDLKNLDEELIYTINF